MGLNRIYTFGGSPLKNADGNPIGYEKLSARSFAGYMDDWSFDASTAVSTTNAYTISDLETHTYIAGERGWAINAPSIEGGFWGYKSPFPGTELFTWEYDWTYAFWTQAGSGSRYNGLELMTAGNQFNGRFYFTHTSSSSLIANYTWFNNGATGQGSGSLGATTVWSDTDWHHIALVHSTADKTITCYNDGVVDAGMTWTYTYATEMTTDTTRVKWAHSGAGAGRHITIDEMFFYNAALTSTQVGQLIAFDY